MNSKILDSCTSLVAAVKELVKRSKVFKYKVLLGEVIAAILGLDHIIRITDSYFTAAMSSAVLLRTTQNYYFLVKVVQLGVLVIGKSNVFHILSNAEASIGCQGVELIPKTILNII